jgi:hypothetical protein
MASSNPNDRRVFVYRDNLVEPAMEIERSSMGVLVEWWISGRRGMVASDQVERVRSESDWENACEFGHLTTGRSW